MAGRTLPLLLFASCLTLALGASEAGAEGQHAAGSSEPTAESPPGVEAEEWIESFDKASNRKFYYSAKTRQSAWDAPAGARIRSQDGSTSYKSREQPTGSVWLVLMSFLLPIVLPLAGLGYCYYMASKQGLHDALKSLKARRERSQKRRSTKAGGRSYVHGTKKMSQDGKGGRSANS
ncbi:hypothetical protein AB1Y20_009455 [Prymnesium parvum]|uniref:WW domain-containing protein n=1 Tax=Prymnesium parvum TaxID=97485 RepID=A0AB34K0C3_PRYPA